MNVTLTLTKYYENERLCRRAENKPNQTQFQSHRTLAHFYPFFPAFFANFRTCANENPNNSPKTTIPPTKESPFVYNEPYPNALSPTCVRQPLHAAFGPKTFNIHD
jgi:hypothetical protein